MSIAEFLREKKIIALNSMHEAMLALRKANPSISHLVNLNGVNLNQEERRSKYQISRVYISFQNKIREFIIAKDQIIPGKELEITENSGYVERAELEGGEYVIANTENKISSGQVRSYLELVNWNYPSERRFIEITREKSNPPDHVSKVSQAGFISEENPKLIIAHSDVGLVRIPLEQLLRQEKVKINLQEREEGGNCITDNQDINAVLPQRMPLRMIIDRVRNRIIYSSGNKVYFWNEKSGSSVGYETNRAITSLSQSGNSLYWGDNQGRIFKNGVLIGRDVNSNPIVYMEISSKPDPETINLDKREIIFYLPFNRSISRSSGGNFLYRMQEGISEPLIRERVKKFRMLNDQLVYQSSNQIALSDLDGKSQRVVYAGKEGEILSFNV